MANVKSLAFDLGVDLPCISVEIIPAEYDEAVIERRLSIQEQMDHEFSMYEQGWGTY